MALALTVNGADRQIASLEDGSTLAAVVTALSLKADRVAIERNGEIAPRHRWAETLVHAGDRLEVVHFVGGGSSLRSFAARM